MSLEIFHEEGIWDLIFSENFFYFESGSDESAGQIFADTEKSEISSASRSTGNTEEVTGVNSLQMQVISFVEFASTSDGNTQNMVGSFISLFWHTYFFVFFNLLEFIYFLIGKRVYIYYK